MNAALKIHKDISRTIELQPLPAKKILKGIDPFSTPARRRRLIADMAKFLLKQYCIKACKNVHQFRIQTHAVIILQCNIRVWLSKLRLWHIRKIRMIKAAFKITKIIKVFLAKKLLKKLQNEQYLKLRTKSAIIIQCMCRKKIARKILMFYKKLRDDEIRRERERAACIIQMGYRAFLTNRWSKIMRDVNNKRRAEELRIYNLKMLAAVIIQCTWRIKCARSKRFYLYKRLQCKYFISNVICGYLTRKKYVYTKNCIIRIQRFVRHVNNRRGIFARLVERSNEKKAKLEMISNTTVDGGNIIYYNLAPLFILFCSFNYSNVSILSSISLQLWFV